MAENCLQKMHIKMCRSGDTHTIMQMKIIEELLKNKTKLQPYAGMSIINLRLGGKEQR